VVALADILQTRFARSVARKNSAAPTASRWGGNAARVPVGQFTFSIDYTSDPARADALSDSSLCGNREPETHRPDRRASADVKAALLRDFETNSHQTAYLVGQLAQRYQSGEPPESVLWQMPDIYRALTPATIREVADICLDPRKLHQGHAEAWEVNSIDLSIHRSIDLF
jgi:hypothetical protein